MDLINIEKKSDLEYVGGNLVGPLQGFPAFGGQLVGQAINAALQTVDHGWECRSSSTYFYRPSTILDKINYKVEMIKEGKYFIVKRVVATQGNKTVIIVDVQFAKNSGGKIVDYQIAQQKLFETSYQPFVEWYNKMWALEYAPTENNPNVSVDISYFTGSYKFTLKISEIFNIHISSSKNGKRQLKFTLPNADNSPSEASVYLSFISDFLLLESATIILKDHLLDKSLSFVTTVQHSINIHTPLASTSGEFTYLIECERVYNNMAVCNGYIFDDKKVHVMTAVQEVMLLYK